MHETSESAGFDIRVNLVNIEQLKSLNPEIDIIDNEKDNVSNGFKITLRPNQQVKLPTGLFLNNELLKSMEVIHRKDWRVQGNTMLAVHVEYDSLPETHRYTPVLKLYPRSSTGLKGLILSNLTGIIDVDFPNEIILLLRNIGNDDITINHGDKLAQGCFETVLRFPGMIKDVERISGFGSTN
jgi:dUTPase